ncbi:MAG: hypothetical protein IKX16_03615 [Clostridia bacterium]|nr:hypothetical protein [Clostridia bacterium]
MRDLLAESGDQLELASQLPQGFVNGYQPVVNLGLFLVYEVALNYITVWYGCVYASMNRMDGVPERIVEFTESRLVPMMLHREIMKWLKEKSRHKLSVYSFKANRKYEFRTVNGICSDYYRKTKEETVFAIARIRFDDADWDDIERAVCSVTRFSDAKIASAPYISSANSIGS